MSENNKEEVEIDLLELAQKLWDNKKFIIKVAVIGAIVGIVIAFSIPKEYTTTVVLTTESSKSTGGSMGALASMAGINLGGTAGGDVFSPELYPDVLNSTPFVQGLLDIKVSDPNQEIDTTLYNYIKDEQKSAWWSYMWGYIIGTPGAIIGLLKSDNSESEPNLNIDNKLHIPKEKINIIEAVKSSYSINTDKIGITTFQITTQNPVISAYLADTLTIYLQSYIIEQRTKKAKTDLNNSEKLYLKAKDDYYKAQQNLASFVDNNRNITLSKYQIHQDRLQNEANLAFSVYNQMAQQVQMNIIKVQDNTPVFTIIQPAVEPIYPSKPSKKLTLIVCLFISSMGASAWVLREDAFGILRKRKNKQ